jgi:precorrin-6Y C5,15-methyltransferase (decarboxylating)
MRPWLSIVGIGDDGVAGLTATARTLVETAETLIGGPRHLAMVPANGAERVAWERPLTDSLAAIAARRGRRVTVLASGDPLWYGVGVMLARHFPISEMTIVPHPGAFSLAAARLGWGLADCVCLSLHARPLDNLRLHLMPDRRMLLLSEDGGTPSTVARLLTGLGWGASAITVLEHLGGEREAITTAAAVDWGDLRVADLNTIALECRTGPHARPLPRLAGLPDEAFEHDGQLTKREVRAVTLASLAPLYGETLWDVGAGCGSIAIEWLRSGESVNAVAIEREPRRAAIIARNAAALGVPDLEIVCGDALAILGTIPARLVPPDAIFVGGGVAQPNLLPALWAALRLGGRLVANVVTLGGEQALMAWHARHGGELTRIALSHAEPLGGGQVWRPQLNVTQLIAVKRA